MTDGQHKLVIASLVVIGLALAYINLKTSRVGYDYWTPRIILFHVARWALYTEDGVKGVILGAVVPLCLFAAAAYLALRLRRRNGRL